MSEEEKAKELVVKYMDLLVIIPNVMRRFLEAKSCAIIAIDEIIKELESHVYNYDMDDHYKDVSPTTTTIPYWHRVKEEIIKKRPIENNRP